jgi:uncharacterized membrane protein
VGVLVVLLVDSSLVGDPDLVVKIGGSLYSWQVNSWQVRGALDGVWIMVAVCVLVVLLLVDMILGYSG